MSQSTDIILNGALITIIIMTIMILITMIFIFLIPNKIQIAAKKTAPQRKNFDKNQGDLNVDHKIVLRNGTNLP